MRKTLGVEAARASRGPHQHSAWTVAPLRGCTRRLRLVGVCIQAIPQLAVDGGPAASSFSAASTVSAGAIVSIVSIVSIVCFRCDIVEPV